MDTGNSSGSGSGYGYGYGDGDGSGYGYGYGDGDGYGYGDGDGYGSGYGDGDGSGYGYGYGDGSGYGYGYGYGDFVAAMLNDRFEANEDGRLAIWLADKNGAPANGGSGGPRRVGQVEQETGANPCCAGMLHATLQPWKWSGERMFVVELSGDVKDSGDKLASTKRRIIAEIQNFCLSPNERNG